MQMVPDFDPSSNQRKSVSFPFLGMYQNALFFHTLQALYHQLSSVNTSGAKTRKISKINLND